MERSVGLVALVVHDYDEALAFFVGALGMELVEDRRLAPNKRWVVVGPAGGRGARLLLARAADAAQAAAVGRQAGGRVAFFLETDDFARDHALFGARGVRFLEGPRREAYGTVAVFEDLYGNRWDLIEPRDGRPRPGLDRAAAPPDVGGSDDREAPMTASPRRPGARP